MTAKTRTAPVAESVEPLDPDSAKGREIAARLSATLADVRDEITARKARENATQTQAP